jgi:hypothetical protein
MLGTAMITVIFTMAYLAVSLLFPTGRPTEKTSREPHTPGHAGGRRLEEQFTELFIEQWLKGQEQWVRYAWIEPTAETVSW